MIIAAVYMGKRSERWSQLVEDQCKSGRGMSRLRPPFLAVKGLWGHPTNINNDETYVNVSYVFYDGVD